MSSNNGIEHCPRNSSSTHQQFWLHARQSASVSVRSKSVHTFIYTTSSYSLFSQLLLIVTNATEHCTDSTDDDGYVEISLPLFWTTWTSSWNNIDTFQVCFFFMGRDYLAHNKLGTHDKLRYFAMKPGVASCKLWTISADAGWAESCRSAYQRLSPATPKTNTKILDWPCWHRGNINVDTYIKSTVICSCFVKIVEN